MSKLFGGKSPFDDPFFTEPFGGNKWLDDYEGSSRKQITIEELSPEDGGDHAQNNEEPSKELVVKNNGKKGKSERRQNFSFRRVAYGGINGTYYSCSEGMRVGDDGVVLVEMNEEDETIGESLHTISKGVHNKMSLLILKKHGKLMLINSCQDGMKGSNHLRMLQGLVAVYGMMILQRGENGRFHPGLTTLDCWNRAVNPRMMVLAREPEELSLLNKLNFSFHHSHICHHANVTNDHLYISHVFVKFVSDYGL
ncbi:PREDICTED: uncharacterized protein LOC109150194 isoform X1 [Ipomoea nil]|uniref:uncharacterized protein LOC109150194 isoform X1 n=1 Tax=Ipomoea nil TaxID=35883 RepID=UPI000900D4D3|nr:PREDICTED: uncharacterized protein LOC109150194 isoform X1 [Ipomoea nil]